MERIEEAYAKLNLYLDVTEKRTDGFHNLKSVMHAVTLSDTVTVNAKLADYSCVTVEMVNSDIPADERNLAYLAAETFLEETGISAAVSIRVEKRIPNRLFVIAISSCSRKIRLIKFFRSLTVRLSTKSVFSGSI